MQSCFIPKKLILKKISQHVDDDFLIECSFEVFSLTEYVAFETSFKCDISLLNSIIRNERNPLLNIFEDDLLNQIQNPNPDFSFNCDYLDFPKLEMIKSEVIIQVNQEVEESEFDRIVDVFPTFQPDLKNHLHYIHEFRYFNSLFENVIVAFLKNNFLLARGYTNEEATTLVELNNPIAQQLIESILSFGKNKTEEIDIEQECQLWEYNKIYGIEESDEDDNTAGDDLSF